MIGRGSRRFGLGVLVGVLLGFAFALVGASPAAAHATLASTDPPQNQVLASAPDQITLTFTEAVRPVPARIKVIGPDRSVVNGGSPTSNGTKLVIPLGRDAGKGTYLVTFRVISADSHPIGGSFVFHVGAPSIDPPQEGEAAVTKADPAVVWALGAVRYLGYVGLVLLIGPMLFLARLWPARLSRRVPAKLVATGLGLLAFSTVAEMYLQGPYTAGTGLFGADADAIMNALGGSYGTTHTVRLGVLAAIAVLLRPFVRPQGPSTIDLAVVSFFAVVGLGTWPLSGHAGVSPAPAVSLVADAAHLASMGVWLGGLVVLVAVLLPKANARELGAILPVWSNWAMMSVIVLSLTGVAQAIIEVASFGPLFDTRYGRLVLAKVALLTLVLVVAYFSRRLVLAPARKALVGAGGPADDDEELDEPPVKPLRRSILAELAITGVVPAVAAALVQTPPARSAADAPPEPYSVTLSTDLYRVRMELDPARTGGNSMHLYAYNPNGEPQTVVEWTVTATPADGSIDALDIPLLPVTADHAVAEPTFPTAGDWDIKITLRLSDIDQATVTQRVRIGD
ncbi:copper resistance protein CopC [Virgisporangium ochraceum]